MNTEEKKETVTDKAKDVLASATTAAKAQIDALKTKEGRDALKDKTKQGISCATVAIKEQINGLKTKEGRQAFVQHLKEMPVKRKVVLGVCLLIVVLFLLKITSCVFGGRDDGAAASKAGEKSPIEGLMGYKLGEVFEGQLGNPAILVGADWYCVGNKAEFHGYKTCIKILPRTKKICAIHVSSSDPQINLQTELATVETMLRKKYKDIEFEKLNDLVTVWKPKTGSRVLLAGIMQHPLAPCVKIEVHDLALEPLIEKEKNDTLREKASQEADKAGDVL